MSVTLNQKRRKQYTCRCPAYDFPHRFGGGRCNGLHLCEPSSVCQMCHLNNGGCEVVKGQEHPRECPQVQDFCAWHEIKL